MLVQNQAKFSGDALSTGNQEMNCPAFSSMLTLMNDNLKWTILDLGPARSSNLSNLANFRCKIFIEDSQELLRSFTSDALANEALLKNWLVSLPEYIKPASVDLVLAWDVPNYLDDALNNLFLSHINPLLSPTAYLHCLTYSQHEMPAQPTQFTVLSNETMKCSPTTQIKRPSPRFTQRDIIKRLPDFIVVKSFLLRNGVQEFLLRKTPP